MLLELQDRLHAMKRQERHYMCTNYTKPPPPVKPQHHSAETLVNLLQECALLVLDPALVADHHHRNNNLETAGRPNSQSRSTPASSSSATASTSATRIQQSKASDVTPKSPSSILDAHHAIESSSQSSSSPSGTATATDAVSPDDTTASACNTNPELGYWRLQMFDWACMIVDGFDMDRSAILATAFNLLDRYTVYRHQHTASEQLLHREDFQLICLTALYMAVKVLEPYPRKMSLESMSLLSHEFYSPEEIAHQEWDILVALQWRISPPTAIGFCRELVPFLGILEDDHQDLEQIYSAMCDCTVADAFFLDYPSSMIALASILHAVRLTGTPRRKRNLLRRQALAVLEINDDDAEAEQMLQDVYQKLEELYC